MIGDLVAGGVRSARIAVSPVLDDAEITPSMVDVHALGQQAGEQITEGEQPTSTIQRRRALSV